MQTPDDNSTMTQDFVYIDATGLQTENSMAPKSRVPWIASQTDLLADDWRAVGNDHLLVSVDKDKYPDGFDISVSGMCGHDTLEILNLIDSAAKHAVQGALNAASNM